MYAEMKVGVVACVLVLVVDIGPLSAADLNGGSLKDSAWDAPVAAPVGPCYFRSDLGYSWSRDPSSEYVGNVEPSMTAQRLSSGWFAEAGLGCGSGSRGLRGELMLGLREEKDFGGDYIDFTGAPVDSHLTTSIRSYTTLLNAYYDLGNMNGLVPYVGAGIGFAYHDTDDVLSDVRPGIQFGEDKLSFAWALMAGFGYQLSDRAILDIGYRYIDLGSARSSHADNGFAWNPRLEVRDMTAHEFKVGLRYHLGTASGFAAR